MVNNICFPTSTFLISTTVLIISILSFTGLFIYYKNNENDRFATFCQEKIDKVKSNINNISDNIKVKLTNPIDIIKRNPIEMLPERRYIGRDDYSANSQQVGFVFDGTGQRFPLYENRRDTRYYYHIKDDTRHGIRIVIDTVKNDQLNDNQSINIPELGGDFTVKLYDHAGNRYNPFVY